MPERSLERLLDRLANMLLYVGLKNGYIGG